jgi:L-fucose mutarotase
MRNHKLPCELQLVEKWQFYKEVSVPSHILTVQTADTQIFANLVLDIGVRMF